MSTTFAPNGLLPIGRNANQPYEGATTFYPLTTNNTVAIAKGDPVALVAGSIVAVTANPAAGTLSANSPIGVFMGVELTDPTRTFVCSQMVNAGSITSLLQSNIKVLTEDDQFARFTVAANGPVTLAQVGATISMAGFNADDTSLKVSRLYVDTATISQVGGSTLSLKIVGIDPSQGNAPGDAFTRIIVSWNANVHAFAFAGSH